MLKHLTTPRAQVTRGSFLPLAETPAHPIAILAAGADAALGDAVSWWPIVPFAALLACIVALPGLAPRLWHSNRFKLVISVFWAVWALPIVGLAGFGHAMTDYVAFMAMVGSLFVVAGHVHIEGHWAGRPSLNAMILLVGAMLANLLGTTGASMLLIRLILTTNEWRRHRWHVPVFFIFMVSNTGGLLTPLGDPPLFIGFLEGVPFFWTMRLWPAWLLVNGCILAIFLVVDVLQFRREARPASFGSGAVTIQGGRNLVFLAGIVGAVLVKGWLGDGLAALAISSGLMALMGFLALATSPAALRFETGFTWEPVMEVGALFLGLFITMIPAMHLLEHHAEVLPISRPWHYFWITGSLSSMLDNAPTYAVMAVLARSQVVPGSMGLAPLSDDPAGGALLAAICCGSVFMGANTYIGNGPNFMVRAIAEARGYDMPGFITYMAIALMTLGPVFLLATMILFAG